MLLVNYINNGYVSHHVATGTFETDICRYLCLVDSWIRLAQDCNIPLPEIPTAIDTTVSVDEQWSQVFNIWLATQEAWSMIVDNRGLNIPETDLQTG